MNQKISVAVSGVNIQKEEEWIAVAYPRKWFPAQFIQFNPEQEEAQVHFLKRSTSNVNWFVWPELCGEEPDIVWIDEGMFHFLIRLSANQSIAYLPYIYFQSIREVNRTFSDH